MAPLDDEQKAAVIELIRQDTRAAEARTAVMAEIQSANVAATRLFEDLRQTTEQAVRETKTAIEKQQEDMSGRFATLRHESGDAFAVDRLRMEEMAVSFTTWEAQLKELLQEASDQQIAMKIEATESLSDSKLQGEALKELIAQSSDIQTKQATQVRDVVEGLHLATRDRFNSVEGKLTLAESALHTIHDKLVQYDSLIAGRRQGKGAGRAEGAFPEVRSLIHDTYIKMAAFPDKH